MATPSNGAYVRPAQLSDLQQITDIQARAFARDPLFNWFGSVDQIIPEQEPSRRMRSLNQLRMFQESLTRAVFLVHGRVTVVVIPEPGTEKERIVAVAMWIQPGASVDGTATAFRAKFHRSIWAWGWNGIKRTGLVYKPAIGARVEKELQSKGLAKTEHWRLELLCTDPDEEGKGYCGLLLKEAAEYDASKPFTIEATTPRAHRVYEHYGWETFDTLTFGVGDVDEQGIKRSKENAKGFPVWMMIKYPQQ